MKNPVTGPKLARIVRLTATAAKRSFNVGIASSRERDKAENTYSDGKVTNNVAKKRRGTLTVVAKNCAKLGFVGRKRANSPMNRP